MGERPGTRQESALVAFGGSNEHPVVIGAKLLRFERTPATSLVPSHQGPGTSARSQLAWAILNGQETSHRIKANFATSVEPATVSFRT